jgi:D-amino-acid dehydrogenase
MLPDGPPVLGATPMSNLYLNLGHGAAGWALACGSARVVADIVAGTKPQIDLDGLTIERFRGPRTP